jgi:hypothetical protein
MHWAGLCALAAIIVALGLLIGEGGIGDDT